MKKKRTAALSFLLALVMTLVACSGSVPSETDDDLHSAAESGSGTDKEDDNALPADKLTVEYAAEAAKALYAGMDESLILRSDGKVMQLRRTADPGELVPSLEDIVDISGGVGLRADGTIMKVEEPGQDGLLGWKNIVSVSITLAFAMGLRSDGTVIVDIFSENVAEIREASEWTDITAISAGWGHAVGLRSDGTVVAVGGNDRGECDVSGWTDIVAISAGYGCTIGLRSDGTVVATGWNLAGECDVSEWTDIVAISTAIGTGKFTIGLKSDGTVVATGDNKVGQCDVSDWKDIIAIDAGLNFTLGLRADGTAAAVGANNWNQTEVSALSDIKVP